MPLIALLGHISSVAIDKWSKADEAVSGIEAAHPLQFQLLSRLILLEIKTVAVNPLYHLQNLSNLQNYCNMAPVEVLMVRCPSHLRRVACQC